MSKAARAAKRHSLALQIVVGLWGLVLSIVLHEAFHIAMHWGHITHIALFPSWGTIVQIDAVIPPGYDMNGEEMVAYGITLLVALITVAIIFRIRDADDTRSAGQILFPDDAKMQKMDPEKMLEISGLELPTQKPAPTDTHSTTKK